MKVKDLKNGKSAKKVADIARKEFLKTEMAEIRATKIKTSTYNGKQQGTPIYDNSVQPLQ